MSFPKLKSKTYTAELPISKKSVVYRPYTINEENPLLEARAKEDESEYSRSIGNIVKICTFDKVDPKVESYIDIIYLFMLIRAKSVDEKSVFDIECKECKGPVTVRADITKDLKIDFKDQNSRIDVDNDGQEVTLVMKNLSFDAFVRSNEYQTVIESDLAVFRECLDKIIEGDEVYDIHSATDEEWENFYLSMPKDIYLKVNEYLANQPIVHMTVSGHCPACNKDVTERIEGTSNFT